MKYGDDAYMHFYRYCLTAIPDFKFEHAVMGDAWMRERYTQHDLVVLINTYSDPDYYVRNAHRR